MKTPVSSISCCVRALSVCDVAADFGCTDPSATPIHTWLSALPLALICVSYAVLQIEVEKPIASPSAKRLMLAATFILWAVDRFCARAVVNDRERYRRNVSLRAHDLYWIIQEQRNS